MGFTGLLHLGEMTWPDHVSFWDYKKVIMHFSMKWTLATYSFWLLTHKPDTTFEGNWIVIKKMTGAPNPHPIMDQYIKSHDIFFNRTYVATKQRCVTHNKRQDSIRKMSMLF